MKIYADTSGLFAALVRNDLNHVPARTTFAALLESGCELHTNSYIVLETWALLQSRVGLEAALAFEQTIRPVLHVTWVDEALHRRASERLRREGRRKLSLADCSSWVTMESLGLERAFGYDADFAQAGFRLVGRPEEVGL